MQGLRTFFVHINLSLIFYVVTNILIQPSIKELGNHQLNDHESNESWSFLICLDFHIPCTIFSMKEIYYQIKKRYCRLNFFNKSTLNTFMIIHQWNLFSTMLSFQLLRKSFTWKRIYRKENKRSKSPQVWIVPFHEESTVL